MTGRSIVLLTCFVLLVPALTERPSRRTSSLSPTSPKLIDISRFEVDTLTDKLYNHVPDTLDSRKITRSRLAQASVAQSNYTEHTQTRADDVAGLTHGKLAIAADLMLNGSLCFAPCLSPHSHPPCARDIIHFFFLQDTPTVTRMAVRTMCTLPSNHQITHTLAKHSKADLEEAKTMISQFPNAAAAAQELKEEVFRFKPQISGLADPKVALHPTTWPHMALTAIPSSQSHLANSAGFINNHLMISGHNVTSADRQRRSDTSIKLELQHLFRAESVQLFKNKEGVITTAKVSFQCVTMLLSWFRHGSNVLHENQSPIAWLSVQLMYSTLLVWGLTQMLQIFYGMRYGRHHVPSYWQSAFKVYDKLQSSVLGICRGIKMTVGNSIAHTIASLAIVYWYGTSYTVPTNINALLAGVNSLWAIMEMWPILLQRVLTTCTIVYCIRKLGLHSYVWALLCLQLPVEAINAHSCTISVLKTMITLVKWYRHARNMFHNSHCIVACLIKNLLYWGLLLHCLLQILATYHRMQHRSETPIQRCWQFVNESYQRLESTVHYIQTAISMTFGNNTFQYIVETAVIYWYCAQVARPSYVNMVLCSTRMLLTIAKLITLALHLTVSLIREFIVQEHHKHVTQRKKIPHPKHFSSHYWYRQRCIHYKTRKLLKNRLIKCLYITC